MSAEPADRKSPKIERRIASVSAVTGLSAALGIVLQIVSVPICLHYWGTSNYGGWLALYAAFMMMRTVDTGYVAYIGNKLNMLYHTDDRKVRLTLASAVFGVGLLGCVQLLILLLLFFTDSMSLVVEVPNSTSAAGEALLALLILTLSWVLTGSYLGIVHRFLIPAGLMYQASWWSIAFQVMQFIALISAAFAKLSLLHAAVVFALVQAIVYLASAIYIKCKLPQYYPWWCGPRMNVGLQDLRRSFPFGVSGIVQQGGTSGLTMLVAGFLGAAAVPAYATVRTMCNLWVTLINILTSPLLPDIVRFHVKGEGAKLLASHKAHGLLVNSVVNLSILIAYPFLSFIYAMWTRDQLSLDRALLNFMLATASLAGLSALMSTLLAGINHTGFIVTSAVIRGGLALGLSALFLPAHGVAGIGFAVFASEALVLMLTFSWFVRREFAMAGAGISSSLIGWGAVPSACVLLYLAAETFRLPFLAGSYFLALALAVIGCVLNWCGLDPEVKIRVRSLLRHSGTATSEEANRTASSR